MSAATVLRKLSTIPTPEGLTLIITKSFPGVSQTSRGNSALLLRLFRDRHLVRNGPWFRRPWNGPEGAEVVELVSPRNKCPVGSTTEECLRLRLLASGAAWSLPGRRTFRDRGWGWEFRRVETHRSTSVAVGVQRWVRPGSLSLETQEGVPQTVAGRLETGPWSACPFTQDFGLDWGRFLL